MLKIIKNIEKSEPKKTIQLIEQPITQPQFVSRKKAFNVRLTEKERSLQNVIEELEVKNWSNEKTIKEQKINLVKYRTKLTDSKKQLEKAMKDLRKTQKELKRAKAESKKMAEASQLKANSGLSIWSSSMISIDPVQRQHTAVQCEIQDHVELQCNVQSMSVADEIVCSKNSTVEGHVQSMSVSDENVPVVHSNSKIDDSSQLMEVSDDSVSTVNPKASTIYKCHYCGYKAKKESHVREHELEFCKNSSIRNPVDHRCSVCQKLFTRRRLYDHLKGYANGKHSARGAHAAVTTIEHKRLFDELKL